MRLILGTCCVLIFLAMLVETGDKSKLCDDCPFIPREQSTGTIQCWSGGQLVYQNSIYHNGGVLCSVNGKAIKITGGKSLCVIESSQDSVWNPPTSEESK